MAAALFRVKWIKEPHGEARWQKNRRKHYRHNNRKFTTKTCGEGWVRETTSTRFSPSTMWDPGIELRFSGLEAGSLPLNQLIAPPVR